MVIVFITIHMAWFRTLPPFRLVGRGAWCFHYLLAAATINSSLAGEQPLIEGGSYSRAAFINFRVVPLTDIDTIDRIDFRISNIHVYMYM